MLKSIFCKIMSDEQQRQQMNSLENKDQIYKLFCQNGYTKSYDEFEKEMDVFLNSEDSKKLLNNEFEELSDEMLEMIAGGVNVKRAATTGIAILLTTFTVGAIGNQILSQSNTDNTSSPTQTISTFDNSREDAKQTQDDNDKQPQDDNGGGGAEQTSNEHRNNRTKNKKFRFGQRKGPRGSGSAVHHRTGPNGGSGGPADHHRMGPNGAARGGPADHHRIGPHSGDVANLDNLKIQEANKIIDKLQTELDKIYNSYNSQNPNRGNFAYNCLEKLNQIKQLAQTASIDQLSHFLDKYGDNLDFLSYVLNDGTGNSDIYLRDLYSNLDDIINNAEEEPTYDNWQKEIKDLTNKFEEEKSNLQKEYGKKIINLKKESSDKGLDKGIVFKNGELVLDNQAFLNKQIDQLQTELFQKEHALKEEYEAHLEFLKSNAENAKVFENIETQMQELQEKFENGNIDEDTFNTQLKELQQQSQELQSKMEGFEEDKASEANNAENTKNEETLENIVIQMQELQEKFENGNIDEDTFNAQLEKLQQQSQELQSKTNYTTEEGAKKLQINLLNTVINAMNNNQLSHGFAQKIVTEYNQIFNLITQKNTALKNIALKNKALEKNALENNALEKNALENELNKLNALVENLSKQIIPHIERAQWFISKCEEHPEWTEKDFIDGLSENEAMKKVQERLLQQEQQKQKQKEQEQEQENDEDDLDEMLAELNKPSINNEAMKKVQENKQENKEEQDRELFNELNTIFNKQKELDQQQENDDDDLDKMLAELNKQNKQNKKGNEQNEQKKKDSQNFEEEFKQQEKEKENNNKKLDEQLKGILNQQQQKQKEQQRQKLLKEQENLLKQQEQQRQNLLEQQEQQRKPINQQLQQNQKEQRQKLLKEQENLLKQQKEQRQKLLKQQEQQRQAIQKELQKIT